MVTSLGGDLQSCILSNWTKSYLIDCTMGKLWVNRPRQIPKSREWEQEAYRGGCVDDRFCTFRLIR